MHDDYATPQKTASEWLTSARPDSETDRLLQLLFGDEPQRQPRTRTISRREVA